MHLYFLNRAKLDLDAACQDKMEAMDEKVRLATDNKVSGMLHDLEHFCCRVEGFATVMRHSYNDHF